MPTNECDVAVIGAGIVGIAVAYYLKKSSPTTVVVLIDSHPPMGLTSAKSGENYRNWWPHPVMRRFTDRSIDLMEQLSRETENRLNMTRRGYVLATRATDINALLQELEYGYGEGFADEIRFHSKPGTKTYILPLDETWERAPNGVDILQGRRMITGSLPWYADDITAVIHIRRAGRIDGHQMGQVMLERFLEAGGLLLKGEVAGIQNTKGFSLDIRTADNRPDDLKASQIINAAGPFLNRIAEMVGTELPVTNVLQQKIAFEDTKGVISRKMPFSIDLDAQHMDWTKEERKYLLEDSDHAWVAREMPGAIHCRPEGGDNGKWVKLGWAYNNVSSAPVRAPVLDKQFPEIALRGAARLNPNLKAYYGYLPQKQVHYGGFYNLTEENWPLIGPSEVEGFFVVGAMSGFGTMAACAAGELCAKWVLGETMSEDTVALSPRRYNDAPLMDELRAQSSRGIL